MNNKILTVVLITGITATGFAGISAANEGVFGEDIEQRVDALEEKLDFDGEKKSKFGKRKGLKNLTEEEKLALESMSDDEKKAFFDAKKEEMKANKEAKKAIIDALIAGESLTADQEAQRLEMLSEMEERIVDAKELKPGAEIIMKVLAGDELTDDELSELSSMQEKQAEREAKREILAPIKEKLQAGEDLTDEEQAIWDEHKQQRWEKRKNK